jgi:hypothetical protein
VHVDPARTRLVVRRGARADTLSPSAFHQLGGDSAAFAAFSGTLRRGASPDDVLARASRGELRGAVVALGGLTPATVDSVARGLEAAGAAALVAVVGDPARYRAVRNARGTVRYFVAGGTGGRPERRLPVLVADPSVAPLLRDADGAIATLETAPVFERIDATNVAARLPGSDRARAGHTVVVTAHLDHIGFAAPSGGDSLYNGFMDNATGVAAVLAVARTLVAAPPPTSVTFLFPIAEEEGSLGSAFWVAHPPTTDSIVAEVNVDAGAPLAPPRAWIVEGADGPLVGRAAALVARRCGWSVTSAPLQPTSDHWSFHRRGIPAAFPVPDAGWEGVSSAEEEALIARWWRQHRPDDEWAPGFPWGGLARHAEFVRWLTTTLAGGTPCPTSKG